VNHFTTLGTTAMEGPASATIGGGTTTVVTYVPATRDCTPRSGSGCHGTERWLDEIDFGLICYKVGH
jgi:hypothetical protein